MRRFPEGQAIVYCEGAFGTPNGKTAHGLVRRSERYKVLSVVDSLHAGRDAGELLGGKPLGIPIHSTVKEAHTASLAQGTGATHLVVGLAPDGGRLSAQARKDIKAAIRLKLHVDSGLHDFLGDDESIQELAQRNRVRLRDIRKTPDRSSLHFFSGIIEQVTSLKIAVLGTDSAVGKRTTAWLLVDALRQAGITAELIGTGQTAWMQGVRFGIVLDSLINDFVSGEIEHAVHAAWTETGAEVLVIEGQGSLLNPAYPGGFEIMASARPDLVILQHAPARIDYDGFPGYPIQPIEEQVQALTFLYKKPVAAITINSENLAAEGVAAAGEEITRRTGIPSFDALRSGADPLLRAVRPYLKPRGSGRS